MKLFLSKGFFFSTLSWFCGLVRPRFKIYPSTYRPYVVSTKNRHVVLPSRRVPEIWNRSPFIKSSIPGSSKSRCSRKQTKPSLSTTLLWKWSLFWHFLSKCFLAHFRGFVVSWFGLSVWPSTYRSYVVSAEKCPCTCPWKLLKHYRS